MQVPTWDKTRCPEDQIMMNYKCNYFEISSNVLLNPLEKAAMLFFSLQLTSYITQVLTSILVDYFQYCDVKEHYEMSNAREPDRRSNFFSPPAHLRAVK